MIILDIHMPGIDGYNMTAPAKRRETTALSVKMNRLSDDNRASNIFSPSLTKRTFIEPSYYFFALSVKLNLFVF